MRSRFLLLFVSLSGLAACRGKVLGTVPLNGAGTATGTFVSAKPDVKVWADTDVKWTGGENSKPDLSYEIDVKQGGKVLGHVSCSTADRAGTSVCGSHSDIMGKHDADCEILLGCSLPAFGPSEVELSVTGKTGPNVIAVKKMGLNIRTN